MLLIVATCEVTALIEMDYRHNEAQVEAAALIAPPRDAHLEIFSALSCASLQNQLLPKGYSPLKITSMTPSRGSPTICIGYQVSLVQITCILLVN